MNNITSIRRGYDRYCKKNTDTAAGNKGYLSEEALESLIAVTEAESMLHPPKEFKDDIIRQIHLKKKHRKDRQLFSYSMKVIVATAAALGIVLIVPVGISPEDNIRASRTQTWQEESIRTDRTQMWQEKAGWEFQPYDTESEQMTSDLDPEKGYQKGFGYQLNSRMDKYCSKINEGLNQLVRMEVHINEKEEK